MSPGYWGNLLRHTSLLGRPRRSTYRKYASRRGLPRASSGSQLAPAPATELCPSAEAPSVCYTETEQADGLQGLLQDSRGGQDRRRQGDQGGLSAARPQVPP